MLLVFLKFKLNRRLVKRRGKLNYVADVEQSPTFRAAHHILPVPLEVDIVLILEGQFPAHLDYLVRRAAALACHFALFLHVTITVYAKYIYICPLGFNEC